MQAEPCMSSTLLGAQGASSRNWPRVMFSQDAPGTAKTVSSAVMPPPWDFVRR